MAAFGAVSKFAIDAGKSATSIFEMAAPVMLGVAAVKGAQNLFGDGQKQRSSFSGPGGP